jgi:hypothetical protein
MQSQTWLAAARALLTTFALASASSALVAQADELRKLDGEWIYVEDRTEGRALEQLGPPMSAKFSLRVEAGAVVLTRGHGSGHRDVRVALDGAVTEIADPKTTVRYTGAWQDGAFAYEVEFLRGAEKKPDGRMRREFRVTAEGLVVRATHGSSPEPSIALYRRAEDIAMPAPAKAMIGDLAWLAAAWVGTRSSGASLEERWGPPLGGAMLGASRVVSRGKMSAFEFLRVVERDGGLVYVAQPGGNPPTEFVCTEVTATRAVFDNPRHDYPKRIVYELSGEGGLTATIGFLKGGTPRRFEYEREAK